MTKFKMMMVVLAAVGATAAHADGFKCQTVDGDLNVTIYNHTDPSRGTRVAAIMVLADPAIGQGNKTIARFTEVEGNLSSSGASYDANVDLRFNNSSRKGELILGTKLGQLKTVLADVDYSYASPVRAGTPVAGALTLVKRNGEQIHADLSCARYLKSE